MAPLDSPQIYSDMAVLIPCYYESVAIAKAVDNFKRKPAVTAMYAELRRHSR